MVHHHGAEAFRSFAEVTCYEKVLEQCIPNDLRHIIEDFLNKVFCINVVCIGIVCLSVYVCMYVCLSTYVCLSV